MSYTLTENRKIVEIKTRFMMSERGHLKIFVREYDTSTVLVSS